MLHRSHLLLLATLACTPAPPPNVPAPQPEAERPRAPVTPIVVDERPRPYPIEEPVAFRNAVERGTRTRSGRPGPSYWQQYTRYTLWGELAPDTRRLTGRATIVYLNRSPDTLSRVAVHLYQNLFAPGAARNEAVEVTGGMQIERVEAGGQALVNAPSLGTEPAYTVDGTILWLHPPRAVAPGDSLTMRFTWSFVVPKDGAPRSGTDGEIFFVAYWYPQVAVYDDVNGWQTDQYLGNAEFYMGYGDYDVSLTVPAGMLIGSTGTLTNAHEVLSPRTRDRLAEAKATGRIVKVVSDDDRKPGVSTVVGSEGKITWRFRATNVRDFAFGASQQYLWDASIALVGDIDGAGRPDTAMVHSFYRPDRRPWAWDNSAAYLKHSVEFLSRQLWPYPYAQMTMVDGPVSCGGMEYPMITCIGGSRDTLSLYSVTVHETGHMWFPMQVGSDEKRFAWQDEGLTRFNQAQAMREYFKGYDLERIARGRYLNLAREEGEVELMRHGDRYPMGTAAYGIASYDKMATNLASLRAVLGDELFLRAYREYGRRWLEKHPTPLDMWNTFADVAGTDLSWFWRAWFFETWTLDHAIGDVRDEGDDTEIVIEDRGMAPMPARVLVTRENGRTERLEVPVQVWLRGARRHVLRVSNAPRVTRVEIDAEDLFPDADRANNRWQRVTP